MFKTVYLAGGMKSGWQKRLKDLLPNFNYLDPCTHGFTHPSLYTEWDLQAVREADIVFAYLEQGNPSGYGLCIECGYAWALGKYIIVVDEKSSLDPQTKRQLGMLPYISHFYTDSLALGIDQLKLFSLDPDLQPVL